ncbi:MAG: ribonuclease R, partial [Pseudomonadota bacterium]
MSKIPTSKDILDYMRDHPNHATKRDIARAFGLKGAGKVELKRILRDLADQGHITKKRRNFRDPNILPPVAVLAVDGPDADGDQFAHPAEWSGSDARPRILIIARDGDPALGAGDRILAKLTQVTADDHSHTAKLIRKIGSNPRRILGIYRKGAQGGRILPIDKGQDKEWSVPIDATHAAQDGELVEGEIIGRPSRMGLPRAKIAERLGDPSAPKAISLIAI